MQFWYNLQRYRSTNDSIQRFVGALCKEFISKYQVQFLIWNLYRVAIDCSGWYIHIGERCDGKVPFVIVAAPFHTIFYRGRRAMLLLLLLLLCFIDQHNIHQALATQIDRLKLCGHFPVLVQKGQMCGDTSIFSPAAVDVIGKSSDFVLQVFFNGRAPSWLSLPKNHVYATGSWLCEPCQPERNSV